MKLLDVEQSVLERKLKTYLVTDSNYKSVYMYTKQRLDEAKYLTAHNWAHAYRDTLNAIVIGEAENADMSIVLPAATMHDIGFLYDATGKTHGAVGAEKLPEFLQGCNAVYDDETIAKIADCIRTHKGSMHDEQVGSLEAKVVADADLLEKFGAFGVYQTIRTFAEFNYPLEQILSRLDIFESLTLETKTGKKLAEPGRAYVTNFFKQLAEAYEPYKS